MKVYLDAGHGGRDSGAVGINGGLEKYDCQKVTDRAKKILENCGFKVVVNSSVDQSLSEVVNQANNENVDLFISIHRNAFSDPKANGLEVWVCNNPQEITINNAKKMYKRLMETTTMRERGIQQNNFYVLKNTKAPAMLLELGFITNKDDNELFNMADFGKAIAQGVCDIFNIKFIDNTEFHIQVGKYYSLEEANFKLKELHQHGFIDARIV